MNRNFGLETYTYYEKGRSPRGSVNRNYEDGEVKNTVSGRSPRGSVNRNKFFALFMGGLY